MRDLPRDEVLPALAAVLDPATAEDLLALSLGDAATRLASCRPVYARYKPAASCLVQLETIWGPEPAGFRDGDRSGSAHLLLLPAAAGLAISERASTRRLARLVRRRHPGLPAPPVRWLEDPGVLVCWLPFDRELSALARALDRGKLARWLARADRSLPEGVRPRCARPRIVRYKPGRRAVLRTVWRGAGDRERPLYLRLYAGADVARLAARSRGLTRAGVATPAPWAVQPERGLLAQEAVAGRPLRAVLANGPARAELEALIALLGRLHAVSPADWGEDEAAASLGAEARRAASALADLDPLLGRRAEAIARGLAGLGPSGAAFGAVHGDLYDDQVLLGAQGPVLLDLDRMAMGPAALDIGNFAAVLATRAAPAASEARAVLREAWLAGAPDRGARRELAAWEGLGLLRLGVAPFRACRPDWRAEAERRLSLAEARLRAALRTWVGPAVAPPPDALPPPMRRSETGGARAARAAAPVPPVDRALPGLDRLFDPDAMAEPLSLALGEALRVTAVRLVRHKPGRRCVLRWDLTRQAGPRSGPRVVSVYGKTYASRRGPRVFAAHAAVHASRACGLGVPVPAPIAWLPRERVVLLGELPGRPLEEALLAGERRIADALATAIGRLHRAEIAPDRRHDLDAELAAAAKAWRRAEGLAGGDEARRLLDAAARLAREPGRAAWRWRPVHRDFYHDQVLWGPRGLAILDFDDLASSEPAVDLANFAAHLRLLSLQRPGAAPELLETRRHFLARARAADAGLRSELLDALESISLVRLAAIHGPRTEGARIGAALLREARLGLCERPATVA